MLKIRLQGNKKELRRMMKLLQKNQRCQIGYTSNFMQCDDKKYHRVYVTMYLLQKERHGIYERKSVRAFDGDR